MLTKNTKQKTHYEDSINILRKENDNFRSKLIDFEKLF